MGSCISDPPSVRRSPLDPNNPICKIIGQYDTTELEERWKKAELKIVSNKMESLNSQEISFQQFTELFHKITEFPPPTQRKIYQLFSYERSSSLSKKEFFKSLTLIRKVEQNSEFAPFLFYVYTKDPRHEVMTQQELTQFRRENQKYKKEDEVESDDELQLQENVDLTNIRTTPLSTNEKGGQSSQTLLQQKSNRKSKKKQQAREELGINSTNIKPKESGFYNISDFIKIFSDYNLLSYQIMFSWNQEEEEKELVSWLTEKGIVCKKGEKGFILDYKWWLEWTNYVDFKYGKRIEVEERNLQNYHSAKAQRRFSFQKPAESLHKTQIPSPGEIKNDCLIKRTKDRGTELIANLVEFDNIIFLPEEVWNRLILVYHGGPPIQRIYPEIYRKYIFKGTLNEEGKFTPNYLKKFTWKEGQLLENYLTSKEKKWLKYYKHPGQINWQLFPINPEAHPQIFNFSRTYLVAVPFFQEQKFLSFYNVQETSQGKFMKKRLKNYGAQINISVEGVLTKAQVVEIVSQEEIKVIYTNQQGFYETLLLKIDENLQVLNPENLNKQSQINQLAGLSNLGNTCYMNAVLQCLIRTPYFGKYLQQENFSSPQVESKDKEELLLIELAKIYNNAKSSVQDTVSTRSFKKMLDKYCPFFEGNLQHDAQQFLICLLGRISEEIKSKKQEYTSNIAKSEISSTKVTVNKKIVQFFSGKTEAITTCLRCQNKNKRIEPFFTYSIALPELKETQYFYYFVELPRKAKRTIPVRYGLTLDRKATIENILEAISRTHKKPMENLCLFSVFNNQLLSHLESRSWQTEIAHYLSFNVRLVCYEVEHMCSPTYYDYREHKVEDKSVKIELRQRMYSEKSHDYRTVYQPFVVEVKCETKWSDLIGQIDDIILKLVPQEQEQIRMTPNPQDGKLSLSGIKVRTEENTPQQKISSSVLRKGREQIIKKYIIRIIKTDHYFQNRCVFCRQDFVLTPKSRGRRVCDGRCSFDTDKPLFQDQNFRNINDQIIITVDWQDVPSNLPLFLSHPSFDQATLRADRRKDMLEDLLISSYNNKQTLELLCEKEDCKHNWADRIERISVSPNILLLHLKRFRYEDNRLMKLTNNVVYPPVLKLPGTNDTYELFGVVSHFGNGVGGHYTSFVKVNQKWYNCDDTKVTSAVQGQHIDTNAYLLFYHKTDFEPSLVCLSF